MIYKIIAILSFLKEVYAHLFGKGRYETKTFAEVKPMATVQVTLEASKELTELGQGVAEFLVALKTAMADGFQLGQDIPLLVSAAVTNLVPAVNGITLIKEEYADKKAFMNAVAVIGASVAGAVL